MGTKCTDYPFFIATMPRTGYHHLTSLLASTEQFPRLREDLLGFINNGNEACSDEELITFFDKLKRDKEVNGLWGTKLDPGTFHYALQYLRAKSIRPNQVKWIWLKRREIIKGAISAATALEKDLFFLTRDSPQEIFKRNSERVDIPMEKFHGRIWKRVIRDYAFEYFAKKTGIVPLVVYYEDFADSSGWKPTIVRIMDFLERPYRDNGLPLQTEHIKQSNDDFTDEIIIKMLKNLRMFYNDQKQ
jgi:LPS sulfotransferase NodH